MPEQAPRSDYPLCLIFRPSPLMDSLKVGAEVKLGGRALAHVSFDYSGTRSHPWTICALASVEDSLLYPGMNMTSTAFPHGELLSLLTDYFSPLEASLVASTADESFHDLLAAMAAADYAREAVATLCSDFSGANYLVPAEYLHGY